MRGKRKIHVWPAYFDVRYSRKDGRRVPKNIAIRSPDVQKILDVSLKLELNPIIQEGAYPRTPWIKTGVILVDKKGSKTKILRDIAEMISNSR